MAGKITSTPAPRERLASNGRTDFSKTIDYTKSEFLQGIGENHAAAFSKNANKFYQPNDAQ